MDYHLLLINKSAAAPSSRLGRTNHSRPRPPDLMIATYCASKCNTPSVSKYKTFYRFQYELHTNLYRRILKCIFTYFDLYVVRVGISKITLYLGTEGVHRKFP